VFLTAGICKYTHNIYFFIIKADDKKIVWEGVDWIVLAHDGDRWHL